VAKLADFRWATTDKAVQEINQILKLTKENEQAVRG
jgi:hypothetical protein